MKTAIVTVVALNLFDVRINIVAEAVHVTFHVGLALELYSKSLTPSEESWTEYKPWAVNVGLGNTEWREMCWTNRDWRRSLRGRHTLIPTPS